MSLWTRIRDRVKQDRGGRHLGEADAPSDAGPGSSRATGGGPEAAGPEPTGSTGTGTTGTAQSETYVGRVGGDDDAGAAQESGAERRAQAEDPNQPRPN
ncbi:hypothetical protein [Actinopolymorpha rutila]|uniref:Uncharacterized protein n=1 Tax=Actinopolymorpha rutila TaxID=446787 RepID=A0A852ZPM2_9ACTN|nr:hypothetical protein [Actinopolymorpha rutila]NYH91419.1 hypothetical protein [Actinopolymorpha rutila]